MTSVISEKKYTEFVENLTDWGVIECDNSYQVGVKCKGYKLLEPYNRKLEKVMIKDTKINQKLNKLKEKELSKLKQLTYPYQYLEMWNRKIEMDVEVAKRFNRNYYLNPENMDKYDFNNISIANYEIKNYRYKVDDYFGNRAHTNLTNLNKEFRYTLTVQGQNLGQIDIKNSQPLCFYLLIRDEPYISITEKEDYKQLVESGLFYEFFMKRFDIPDEQRDEYKQIILTGLFSDLNRPSGSRYFDYFEKVFPQCANFIRMVKHIDLNVEKIGYECYKNLIYLLQREESRIVIEEIVGEFINRYEGEFISTIHDSIVVKTPMLEKTKQLMMECFEMIGIQPKLKVSEFTKKK